MNRPYFFCFFLFLTLISACSVKSPPPIIALPIVPKVAEEKPKEVKPKEVKPKEIKPKKNVSFPHPLPRDLVGKYRLFSGSEISFDVFETNGVLFLSTLGVNERLIKVNPIRYKFVSGVEVNFEASPEGIYDRLITRSEGRPQQFIREDSLEQSRRRITNQSIYTRQLMNDLKSGTYTYSRFLSPSRGLVDYSVYLPPDWRRNNRKSYPLVFFLHGQTGWERSFPDSVPESQLNQWIKQGLIPPMVIVSLRTGRLNANVEEQWSSARNETLLTSEAHNELRFFLRKQFRAGITAKTTAIQGHSRGSRGAIHYALKYPLSFSSAVANAFVSDYALEETKQIAQSNHQQILSHGIPLRLSIGDRDAFVLNLGRQATPIIHHFLNGLQIPHDYEVFSGVDHGFVNLWNVRRSNGLINGLGELQFHAQAWRNK